MTDVNVHMRDVNNVDAHDSDLGEPLPQFLERIRKMASGSYHPKGFHFDERWSINAGRDGSEIMRAKPKWRKGSRIQ